MISGNTLDGVAIDSASSTSNHVEGNIIGVDANCCGIDANPLRNRNGVSITGGASNNVVGVSVDITGAVGKGNIISGNNLSGVYVSSGAHDNTVGGNGIGSDAGGDLTFSNFGHGVEIADGNNTLIGGGSSQSQNKIKYNVGAGVRIIEGTGNRVENNRISANGGLGIDLGPEGVTINDAGDGDTGANGLQNSPELTSVVWSEIETRVRGIMRSKPNTDYFIMVGENAVCDPSGFGEGDGGYIGFTVTTDGDGNAVIDESLPPGTTPGNVMTALATGPEGASEYSNCVTITVAPASISGTVLDGSGGPVAGATVIVTSSIGTTRTTSTNASGQYRFPLLAPDIYDVSVFATPAKRVTLHAGEDRVVDFP